MRTRISALLLLATLFTLLVGCKNEPVQSPTASYDIVDALNVKLFVVDEMSLYETINKKIEDRDLSLLPLDGYDFMLLSENGKSGKLAIYSFSEDESDSAVSMGNSKAAGWIGYVKSVELSTYAADNEAAVRNGVYIRTLINTFTPGSEEFVEDALGIYEEPSGDASEIEAGLEITVDTVTYRYSPDNVSFRVLPSNSSIPSAIRPE